MDRPTSYIRCLISCLILCCAISPKAQPYPLWGGLAPGPYAAGFKAIEKYDYSRTFRSKYDYFGEPLPREIARPFQICIWYPAEWSAEDDVPGMVLGEYVFPNPERDEFYSFITALQQRELLLFGRILGSGGLVLDIMNVSVAAGRNAPHAAGQFPLLCYFPDIGHSFADNMVMCEYLATHGYVVASASFVGTDGVNQRDENADLETQVNDMQFILENVRDLEFIDHSKLGAFGTGCGGSAALLMQMRDYRIDAVAELSGWDINPERSGLAGQNPLYNARRMTVPLLHVYGTVDRTVDSNSIDSLRYSDRYMIGLQGISEQGLYSYAALAEIISEDGIIGDSIRHPDYDAACRYVLEFFDAHLKGEGEFGGEFHPEPGAENAGSGPIKTRYLPAAEISPTTGQFLDIIRDHGATRAIELYNKFSETDPGSIIVPEQAMNIIGYRLLQSGQVEEAVDIFRINSETYPNSANCWDSYADGFLAVGENDKAIECYKKVLEVLPVDTVANEQLNQILRDNAERGLERLQSDEESEGQ